MLLQFLAAYGICFGLMNFKFPFVSEFLISIPLFRNADGHPFFYRMLQCAYCTGFHAGWVVWLLNQLSVDIGWRMGFADTLDMVLFSFASSVFCYLVDGIVQRFD